jgi:Tfp pilus assembly protein PilX
MFSSIFKRIKRFYPGFPCSEISLRVIRVLRTRRNSTTGFALIISVLISSIVLGIGLSMFNIGLKESILSSTGRSSQLSFYAADSGIECAEFWDFNATPSIFAAATLSPVPTCNGAAVTNITSTDNGGGSYTHVFTVLLGSATEECAVVQVDKTPAGTVIQSKGYNTCLLTDPRRTERGIKVTYL